MKLFLHIGTNKTATTYLQSILATNTKILEQFGCSYPETGRENRIQHLDLAKLLLKLPERQIAAANSWESDFNKTLDQLNQELCGRQNIIVSSEALNQPERYVDRRIERLFSMFDEIEIIIYLRDHASYLLSWFNSRVWREVETRSFPEFCESVEISYCKKLESLARLGGVSQVNVRPFFPPVMKGQDILTDFLGVIDPSIEVDAFDRSRARRNFSLSPLAQEYFLISNRNRIKTKKRFKFAKFFNAACEGVKCKTNNSMMTYELYKQIKAKYAKDSAELENKYFNYGTYQFSFDDVPIPDNLSDEYSPELNIEHLEMVIQYFSTHIRCFKCHLNKNASIEESVKIIQLSWNDAH